MNRLKPDKRFCGKTVHEMRLADAPFDMIKSGKKTVEVRLNDEKRRQICVGDIIIFRRKERYRRYVRRQCRRFKAV